MLTMTADIYNQTIDFPIEEKIQLVDKLLIDISPRNSEIEKEWMKESSLRLEEYRNGKVNAISGKDVLDKINKKYNYDL